ncbi:MAG: sel1 repeat family protein [Deltaproteobacteria bacterium]|jgi:TPR repeat protein|nr:sel1 repeat family protein [Deltaproteobacteria bacterium]
MHKIILSTLVAVFAVISLAFAQEQPEQQFDDLPTLQKKAQQGDPAAYYNLGVVYDEGILVQKNVREAFLFYLKSAELGHPQGQHNTAVCYDQGEGVERDPKKAVEWYQKAAAQNLPNSQYNLAVKYYTGDGVETDLVKSKYWMEKAAANGFQEAISALKEFY